MSDYNKKRVVYMSCLVLSSEVTVIQSGGLSEYRAEAPGNKFELASDLLLRNLSDKPNKICRIA